MQDSPVKQVNCWQCKEPLSVTDANQGKKVKCPKCGTKQRMPRWKLFQPATNSIEIEHEEPNFLLNHSEASSDPATKYIGPPPRPLLLISQELGKPIDANNFSRNIFEELQSEYDPQKALLDYCEQQLSIQALLKEFKISRQDLREMYYDLLRAGAGQWTRGHFVAASALAYPDSLRYLLIRRKESLLETAYNLIMYFEKGMPLE